MLRKLLISLLLIWPHAAVAQDLTEVDAELFLAVDVSRSMSITDLELQRRGYAEALMSDDVVNAITSGFLGRVAVTYVEWAANYSQRTVVGWRVISSREEAVAFAAELTASFDSSMRRTSISGAIDYAAHSIETNRFTARRRIIDISGDGPNNQGRPVIEARDEALAAGFVINGLPLMTQEEPGLWFHLDNLDEYYQACVVGGPGSFVIPVNNWDQFPAAVRRKLALELADGIDPPVATSIIPATTTIDCLIGEKMWEQRRRDWDSL